MYVALHYGTRFVSVLTEPLVYLSLSELPEHAASLPVEFGLLDQLRVLDISNNCLSSVPPSCFAQWHRLEKLIASDNKMNSLVDIGLVTSLKELDLHNNRLRTLAPEIANLKQLVNLNLEGNCLSELPAQLSTMQLEKLEVGLQNGCIRYERRISSLDPKISVSLTSLNRSPPPEIASMGSSSIMSYLNQLLRGQQLCFRMKLMFVGQENVGYIPSSSYNRLPLPPNALLNHKQKNIAPSSTTETREACENHGHHEDAARRNGG